MFRVRGADRENQGGAASNSSHQSQGLGSTWCFGRDRASGRGRNGCPGQMARMERRSAFAEAQQLVQQGHEAEKGSYAEAEGAQEPRVNRPSSYLAALKHYEQALKTTRQLTQEYPATVAARKFAEHDVRLGPYAVSELEKTLIQKCGRKL